jgi:hypothetical protein
MPHPIGTHTLGADEIGVRVVDFVGTALPSMDCNPPPIDFAFQHDNFIPKEDSGRGAK